MDHAADDNRADTEVAADRRRKNVLWCVIAVELAIIGFFGLGYLLAALPKGVPKHPYGDWRMTDGSHWLQINNESWRIVADKPDSEVVEGSVIVLDDGWEFEDAAGKPVSFKLSEDRKTLTLDGVTYGRVR
jgi:hypothetical protein